MSRATRYWIVFSLIIAAGFALSVLASFVAAHPWQFIGLVAFAWAIAAAGSGRAPWPFNATMKRLELVRGRFVYFVREFGLPLVFIAGFVAAVHVALHHGGVRGFLGVLTSMYVVDRLLAAAVGYVTRRVEARRFAKAWGTGPVGGE